MTTILRRLWLTFALPVVLVAMWWIATSGSTSYYWPPLRDVLGRFDDVWLHGRLSSDVLPSLGRFAAGYAIALVVGVAAGTFIGWSRGVRAYFEPVLEFFRAIPPPLLVPVVMLFAGTGNEMKVIVIATGCVWPVLLNTVEGIRSIDSIVLDTSRSYRLGLPARIFEVALPSASPTIAAGARQALSIGVILMVISEMFAANSGLGFTLIQFQRTFAIPEMWTGIVLLGVIGVLLALLFRVVEAKVLTWYTGARRASRSQ